MNRSLPREIVFLSAPLLVVGAVALWTVRRPKPVVPMPKKWRIESELVRHSPSPVAVRMGMDTEFDLKVRVLSPKDEGPAKKGSMWNDIRLVEITEGGSERRVWDFTRRYYDFAANNWKQIRRLGFGGNNGGGNAEGRSSHYIFALRRLAHPTRHLELRMDSVWRPVVTQGTVTDATPGEVAQMRTLPDALFTSRRWVLREAGKSTPTPRVSTDPLFDIRSVEVSSNTSNSRGPCLRVTWHVLWRGEGEGEQYFDFAPCDLGLYDEKNNCYGFNPLGLDGDRKKGRSFSIFDEYPKEGIHKQAGLYGSKALFVRGWISINGRWPRQVNTRLPDWVLKGVEASHPPTK